jgi:hypothetical protein
MAKKIVTKKLKWGPAGQVPYYVSRESDLPGGNFKQFSAEEVENNPAAFEISESAVLREVMKEGWTKADLKPPQANTAERLKSAFEALGMPKDEAAIAATGSRASVEDRTVNNSLGDLLQPER